MGSMKLECRVRNVQDGSEHSINIEICSLNQRQGSPECVDHTID